MNINCGYWSPFISLFLLLFTSQSAFNVTHSTNNEQFYKASFAILNYNNLDLVIKKSGQARLIFKCKRGFWYKGWSTKSKDRQHWRLSAQIGCPYIIRLHKKKNGGFRLLLPANNNELYYNHPFDKSNLPSDHSGRLNILTYDDIKKIKDGITHDVSTKSIQDFISVGQSFSKLNTYDINNMIYIQQINRSITTYMVTCFRLGLPSLTLVSPSILVVI